MPIAAAARSRSPHWLFDERYYRRRYPDLRDDVLQPNGVVNGYDHFLRHGAAKAASAIRCSIRRSIASPLTAGGSAGAGIGAVPITCGIAAPPARNRAPRCSSIRPGTCSVIRSVAEAMAAGQWRCALQHYLCNDTPTEFDPLPEFSEHFYLARNPGVAESVQRGERRNGYAHFLTHGAAEQRAPCEAIDLRWYASQPQVRDDLEQRPRAHAFEHWLLIGRHQGAARRAAARGTPHRRPGRAPCSAARRTVLAAHAAGARRWISPAPASRC